MSNWNDLGVVDTIYEEDYESPSSSPSFSLSLSSPPTTLRSRIESWSLATGQEKHVVIYVQGTRFHLHKDPLTSRSAYFKRQLTELSEVTLPLNITGETFSLVADFCYGAHVIITPFNVAALRTAAELLGMTETNHRRDDNLKQITETYFRRVVAVNRDIALIVLRSCLRLLPESETTALLVSRCFEVLDLTDDGEELEGCLDDILTLPAEQFQIIAESMQHTVISHDLLYRIIDLYIKEQRGKLTEDRKAEICNFIDCGKLSAPILLRAVQNPRLPLRFIVRAMLMEQLNTRRAILSTFEVNHRDKQGHYSGHTPTLGSILRTDAAEQEAARLKAEMDATNSRIESLEKELSGMRKLLQKSEQERCLMEKKVLERAEVVLQEPAERDGRNVMESPRSASFHYGTREAKVEKGQSGSTSFASFRFGIRGDPGERNHGGTSSFSKDSCNGNPRTDKDYNGKGWISRLKSRLRVSKSSSKCRPVSKSSSKENGNGTRDDVDAVVATKVDAPSHRRACSLDFVDFLYVH